MRTLVPSMAWGGLFMAITAHYLGPLDAKALLGFAGGCAVWWAFHGFSDEVEK